MEPAMNTNEEIPQAPQTEQSETGINILPNSMEEEDDINEEEPPSSSSSDSDDLPRFVSKENFSLFVFQLSKKGLANIEILRLLKIGTDPSMERVINTLPIEQLIAILVDQLFANVRHKLPDYNTMDDVVNLIRNSHKIAVISGAGISTSCGIPDFRSKNGLYNLVKDLNFNLTDPQDVFDKTYFNLNPEPFYKVSKMLFQSEDSYNPSITHKFIKLIEDHNKLLRNYTQNIDRLENKVGIKNVIQCHGSYNTASCTHCGFEVNFDIIIDNIRKGEVAYCEHCQPIEVNGIMKRGVMKPSIVFFGEQLPDIFHDNVHKDMDNCDLIFVIGSSLKVSPVNRMIGYSNKETPVVLINREIVGKPDEYDIELLGDCDVVVKELIYKLGWNKEIGMEDIELKRGNEEEKKILINDEKFESVHNVVDYYVKPYLFCKPNTYIFDNGICKHMENRFYDDDDEEEEEDENDENECNCMESGCEYEKVNNGMESDNENVIKEDDCGEKNEINNDK